MFKLHKVGLLKEGDRFAFVSDAPRQVDGGGGMATGNLLVVTRTAQVNRAAESCFFRYREADDGANTNHSWNGNPEADVQLEVEGVAEPEAVAPADDDEKPEPAPKRAGSVKLVKQKSVTPEQVNAKQTTKPAGKKKTPVKAAASAKPAATKPAASKAAKGKKSTAAPAAAASKTAKTVKPSQRLVLRSTSGSAAVSSRGAAEHSSSRAKRPAMTPQLKLKKSRRA